MGVEVADVLVAFAVNCEAAQLGLAQTLLMYLAIILLAE